MSRDWRVQANVSALLALAGFLFSALVFYPGLFTPDSMIQFEQAQSGAFSDWHPPAMAALWRALLIIHRGPEPLFLLHLALFWIGIFAFGDGMRRSGAQWGQWLPLFGFAPFVFNYLGLLWKDVALAVSWFCATGLVFHQRTRERPASPAEKTFVWLAFIYGALVRANSIFAAAPLALYLLKGDALSRKLWPQALAFLLTPAALIVATHIVDADLLRAKHEHPEDSLMLFDLAGISHNIGANLVPGPYTPEQAAGIPGCYKPDKWDWLGTGACAYIGGAYDDNELWGAPMVPAAWRTAVLHHPIAYVKHRLAFTAQLLRFSDPIPTHDIWMESEMPTPQYMHHPGAIFRGYEAFCQTFDGAVIFRPWFWLLLAFLSLAVAACARPSEPRRLAAALSASAIIYLLTYATFGVASDFRYAYWTIMATIPAGATAIAAHLRNGA